MYIIRELLCVELLVLSCARKVFSDVANSSVVFCNPKLSI